MGILKETGDALHAVACDDETELRNLEQFSTGVKPSSVASPACWPISRLA